MALLKNFKQYIQHYPLKDENPLTDTNIFEVISADASPLSAKPNHYYEFIKAVKKQQWEQATQIIEKNPNAYVNSKTYFMGNTVPRLIPSPFGPTTKFEENINCMSWASYFVLMEQPKLFDFFIKEYPVKSLISNENNNEYNFNLLMAILLKDDLTTLQKMEKALNKKLTLDTLCKTSQSIQKFLFSDETDGKEILFKAPKITDYLVQNSSVKNCPLILFKMVMEAELNSLVSLIIEHNPTIVADYVQEVSYNDATSRNTKQVTQVVAEHIRLHGEVPRLSTGEPLLMVVMHSPYFFRTLSRFEEPVEQLKEYLKTHNVSKDLAWQGPVLQVLHDIGYPLNKMTGKGNIAWTLMKENGGSLQEKTMKLKELEEFTQFCNFFIKQPQYLYLFNEKIKGESAIDLLSQAQHPALKEASLKIEKLLLKEVSNPQNKTHLKNKSKSQNKML